MRIFCAGVATETNTFSPIFVDLQAFREHMYLQPGEHGPLPRLTTGPLIAARRRALEDGFELVEGSVSWTEPAGLIARDAYEHLRDEILDQLRTAMPVDGVAYCLHGAMVAQGYTDPEGDLLERTRMIVGPDVPIAAGLDPHCQLSPRRVANADIFVAFKEVPHTDFVERGEEVIDLLLRTIHGEVRPVMSVFDCRMIDVFPTSWQPMRGFVDRMFEIERTDPKVLSLSLIHGFMAGDAPDFGTRMLVITDDAKRHGDVLAERLGREVFSYRGQAMPELLTPDQCIDRALAHTVGPTVIADFWDNPGGGVAGDSTIILKTMLDRGVTNAALAAIWDPIAVRLAATAGEGSRIPLRFGSKSAPQTGDPIDATVLVKRVIRDGYQTFGVSRVGFGDAVLVEVEGIEVILITKRTQTFERTMFSACGVDPLERRILVVKSTAHYYADFSKISSNIVHCAAGKPYPSDPKTNDYRLAPRSIWPIVENPFTNDLGH